MDVSAAANFGFLAGHDPLLAKLPVLAEKYFADDPVTAIEKLRQFGEQLAARVAAHAGVHVPGEEQFSLLKRLERDRVLPPQTAEILHGIRKAGNDAVHDRLGDHNVALFQLRMAQKVAVWFYKFRTGQKNFKAPGFVPPTTPADPTEQLQAELSRLRSELDEATQLAQLTTEELNDERQRRARVEEDLEAAGELNLEVEEQLSDTAARLAELEQLQAEAKQQPAQRDQKVKAGFAADSTIELTEADTRKLVDAQLREAGWEVDSEALHWKQGTRPQKGQNLAIAEWPTSSGPVDYALFCGLSCVGVIEAKREGVDVPGTLQQAKRYAKDMQLHDAATFAGGPWNGYRVPFVFATNGRPYLRQLKTKSGIWFWDVRRNEPSDALPAWHSPEDLENRLLSQLEEAHELLETEPMDYLGLRDYQCAAIRAAEKAIEEQQARVLLAMATGTGKTRTAIGLIYRLVKSKRFRRVLFLVDRTSLGEQAEGAFKSVKLERFQSFKDIYDMKVLGDLAPDKDTKLQFATVQSMMRRILAPSEGNAAPSVGQYDCIVVDECHRGYNLDREMSDEELTFRDEADYISKYRQVLEYFDAVAIGLTATPALHTTEIFGRPVYTYSYRDAVIDGHLIDHEPPIRIATKLLQEGIGFRAGEAVETYDVGAKQLDLVEMPDDVNLEVESFHKKVITENFTKTVCAELARRIDPSLDAKTLVFAVTTHHADQVVAALKEAFREEYGHCNDDAVLKITGNVDRPLKKIREFKNERQPNVVVTVDLLTTGIDVPPISNVVFMRRVRSRILYEQMLGRATRRCDEIGKEYFRIYDCVDLYAELEQFNSMKPVVTNPTFTFDRLATEMRTVKSEEARKGVLDQFIAKLQAKARRIGGDDLEEFVTLAEAEPRELAGKLRKMSPDEATAWFEGHPGVASFLDEARGPKATLLISEHEDELREVSRGYGQAGRPEDYLESFKQFVTQNINHIPALTVVTQRPRELTREQLKELKRQLDAAGFSETSLRTAVRETSNVDIAASIVGYVRQQALGSALEPYEERVDRAVKKILSSNTFNEGQRQWLKRIAKQMKKETIVDRASMDRGAFRAEAGGFDRINKRFEGRLEQLLGDLREAVWEDAG